MHPDCNSLRLQWQGLALTLGVDHACDCVDGVAGTLLPCLGMLSSGREPSAWDSSFWPLLRPKIPAERTIHHAHPRICIILILHPTAESDGLLGSGVDAGFVSQQKGSFQPLLSTCLESRYAKGAEDSSLEPAKHTGL